MPNIHIWKNNSCRIMAGKSDSQLYQIITVSIKLLKKYMVYGFSHIKIICASTCFINSNHMDAHNWHLFYWINFPLSFNIHLRHQNVYKCSTDYLRLCEVCLLYVYNYKHSTKFNSVISLNVYWNESIITWIPSSS